MPNFLTHGVSAGLEPAIIKLAGTIVGTDYLKLTGTSHKHHDRNADTHRVHEAVLDDSKESLDSEIIQMIQNKD